MPTFTCQIDQKLSIQHNSLVIRTVNLPSSPLHNEVMSFLKPFREQNDYRIPYRKTREFLTLMVRAGCLHLGNKQVIPDLYGSAELIPREASGWITLRDQGFYLHECDFVCAGPPHWFIKKGSLKFLETELTWSQMKQAFSQTLPVEDGDADPLPVLKLNDRTGAFADLWLNYGEDSVAYHDPRTSFGKRRRSKNAESGWEKDLLETDFMKKQVDSSHYYCPMDKVAKSLTFLIELGWQVIDHQARKVVRHSDITVAYENQEDALLIKGKLQYDDHAVNLQDIVGAFNRKERFVSLDSLQVGLIPETSLQCLEEEGEIVSEGIKISRHCIAGLEPIAREIPSLRDLIESLSSFEGLPMRAPSPQFLGTLRPYQQEGLNWLAFLYENRFHGLLADEMGLGKTVQVLAFLSQLVQEGPHLIVMPTTLLFHWKQEIRRFLPQRKILVFHGAQRDLLYDQETIILTSYATLRRDLPQLSAIPFQCVILDEAQAIKNARTQSAQAVCHLRALFRLSLTGTPIENREEELWSHFHFLMPQILGSEEEFRATCIASGSDERYQKRIKKKIRSFILRRKKSDVAQDLPEKIEQVVWVEMEEEQRLVYEQFLQGIKSRLLHKITVDGVAKHRMEMFEAILRLRQLCCHPLLFQSSPAPSAKLEALLDDIQTVVAEGHKVLVYSQFTSMLKLIGKQLNMAYAYLDGSTRNREEVVTQFQENPELPVFLISLKAGGVGLNLTAADYVFIYDPWWNDAVENQAINRVHRIGQDNTVIAKRYIMAESIEEKMLKIKEKKRITAEQYIDDNIAHENLTDEDLLLLLE